jgi:catechol 2,3-dioxygenase-like lactoylglutathione lyase family enzyme
LAHQISGIGHVTLATSNLAEACRAFQRLGFAGGEFRLGSQALRLTAGGRCPASLTGLGLATRDMAATRASLAAVGIELPAPAADGTVALPLEASGGLPTVLVPVTAATDQPSANGSFRIQSVTAILAKPESVIAAFNTLFGPASCTPTDEMVTVHTGAGLLFLVTPGGFDDLHPSVDIGLPGAPALAVVTVGVRAITATAACLAAQKVSAKAWGDHLAVRGDDCLGIGLEFAEA